MNSFTTATSVIAAPQITFITERFSVSGSGFVFPTLTANRPGLFGPNFAFDIIPEPTTPLLLLVGILMLSPRIRGMMNERAARIT